MRVKAVPAIYCGMRAYEMQVDENESVKSVKDEICRFETIPSFLARLLFSGKAVDENTTLKNLGINEGNELELVVLT